MRHKNERYFQRSAEESYRLTYFPASRVRMQVIRHRSETWGGLHRRDLWLGHDLKLWCSAWHTRPLSNVVVMWFALHLIQSPKSTSRPLSNYCIALNHRRPHLLWFPPHFKVENVSMLLLIFFLHNSPSWLPPQLKQTNEGSLPASSNRKGAKKKTLRQSYSTIRTRRSPQAVSYWSHCWAS